MRIEEPKEIGTDLDLFKSSAERSREGDDLETQMKRRQEGR